MSQARTTQAKVAETFRGNVAAVLSEQGRTFEWFATATELDQYRDIDEAASDPVFVIDAADTLNVPATRLLEGA